MRMQIIENWSIVEGSVISVEPNNNLAGYVISTLHVLLVVADAAFPNLFFSAAGSEISVNIPVSKAGEIGLCPGDSIRLRIRKAGPAIVFADPDSITKTA